MRILHLEFLFPNTLTLGYDLSGSIIDGITDREFHLLPEAAKSTFTLTSPCGEVATYCPHWGI